MSQRVNDERARAAYQLIEKISTDNDEEAKKACKSSASEEDKLKAEREKKQKNKEFRSIARSFPTKVQTNGLLVAVAFLDAKDEQHMKLKDALGNWLYKKDSDNSKKINLTKELVKLERDSYRLDSQEAMAYAQWVKRFAEGRWDKDGQEKQ